MNNTNGFNNGGFISNIEAIFKGNTNNEYNNPINTIEKDNKKYLQYKLIGLNSKNIKVEKKFVNKTRELFVIVTGKFKDEVTGWENDININLRVDYRIYDKVTYNIQDGILTIILHEIINEEPEVELYSDYGWMSL